MGKSTSGLLANLVVELQTALDFLFAPAERFRPSTLQQGQGTVLLVVGVPGLLAPLPEVVGVQVTLFEQGGSILDSEDYLKPLAESIVNQDFNDFQNKFNAMVQGCNSCHEATGHRYIVYRLPDSPLVPAQLDTGQTFTRQDLLQLLADLLGEEE